MCKSANKIISSTFAATIMKIGYGIAVKESDDPYISMAEIAFTGASEAAVPGAFLVDLFPILKYVPSWFPGAGFQKKAIRVRSYPHNGRKTFPSCARTIGTISFFLSS